MRPKHTRVWRPPFRLVAACRFRQHRALCVRAATLLGRLAWCVEVLAGAWALAARHPGLPGGGSEALAGAAGWAKAQVAERWLRAACGGSEALAWGAVRWAALPPRAPSR